MATLYPPAASSVRPWQSKRVLTALNKTVTFLILTGAALLFLLPLFWMVSTSLKPKEQIFAYPLVWLPDPPQWINYSKALNNPSFKFLLFLQNSLYYAVTATIGTVISCALVAYAFARLRWWGRDVWFVITLSSMMIPGPSDPVDDQTQVVTFMKGLNDGPVKTYLFREYPETMEEAISLAIQEDFSLSQAYMHSSRPRQGGMQRKVDRPEPMDLSNVETKRRGFHDKRCNRCQAIGHFAYECMAPKPVPRTNGSQKIHLKKKGRFANLEETGSSKNDQDQ